MAVWYLGSTLWTGVTAWAADTAYLVGDLRRQLAAPAVGSERVFRCTTAGTSHETTEPTWTLTKGGTTNDGTVVWTEVTGNSTYGWTAPHARLASAFAWMAAGDTVYVSDSHAESQSSAITLTSPGTAAAPCYVLCVDDSATPPTALATSATISTTNGSDYSIICGGFAYCYGVSFIVGSGSTAYSYIKFQTGKTFWRLDNCVLFLNNSHASSRIYVGSSSSSGSDQLVEFVATSLKFGHVSQAVYLACAMRWSDSTALVAGGTVPTALFISTQAGTLLVEAAGVDFSALGSGKAIVNVAGLVSVGRVNLTNCKLGADVSITTGGVAGQGGMVVRAVNCDSADTNYRYYYQDYAGTILNETTIVRTSGASDGTTPISRKMTATADAKFVCPLVSDPIAIWNETTGSELTATVEVVTDGVTLTDAEAWIEVEYLGTSGFPLSLSASDRAATILATPANQTTSVVDWTTTGLSSPVKQKLSVAFTPQEKGFVKVRVHLAKASTTMYFCYKVDGLETTARQLTVSDIMLHDGRDMPAVADVEDGVFYAEGLYEGTLAGGGYTYGDNSADKVLTTATGAGTYQPVAAADVQEGVAVGVSPAVGTFTSPAVGKVIDDTSWGAGGVEFTGTYHPCLVAEVLDSVSFGAASAETGTYHAPEAAEVISTAVFGVASGTAGTYDVSNVSAGNIKDGISIGGVEGTYDPMAAAVFPAAANVEVAETAYGPTGAEYAGELDLSLYTLTSGIVWPAEANVSTVETAWGPTGIEYAGSLNMALYTLISGVVSNYNVRSGIACYTGGPTGLIQVPAVGNVRKGVLVNVEAAVGTLVGCVDTDGVNQGATGILATGSVYYSDGVLAAGTRSTLAYAHTTAGGTLTFADTTYVLSTAPDYGIGGTGGAKTATLTAAGNVLTGTGAFGVNGTSVTPSYSPDFPEVGNVLSTDTVDGASGTYVAPVQAGYSALAAGYGAGGATTGTLAAAKIFDGTYGTLTAGSILVAAGGTYVDPADAEVKLGTAVGVSPRAGTWDAVSKTDVVSASYVVTGNSNYVGGDAGTYPTTATTEAAQLAEDVAAVEAQKASILNTATILTVTGTFNESSRNTDPGEANVVDGVIYKILNVSKEGTYVGEAGYTYGDNDASKVLTTATGAGTYLAISVDDALHKGSGYFGVGGAVNGNYYAPSSQAGVTTTTTYGVSNATSGTLNLTLYCLISGITWPALDEVDGGVQFGPTTGTEYEGTGVNATTLATTVDARLTAWGKTGFSLASTGLDSVAVTDPTSGTDAASTFTKMTRWLFLRFWSKNTMTSSTLTTYKSDGTTSLTTQTLSDDSTTQTQGKAT